MSSSGPYQKVLKKKRKENQQILRLFVEFQQGKHQLFHCPKTQRSQEATDGK